MFRKWWKKLARWIALAITAIAPIFGGSSESTPQLPQQEKPPRLPESGLVVQNFTNAHFQSSSNGSNLNIAQQEISANLLETVGGITESEIKKQDEEIHRRSKEKSKLAAEDGGRKRKDEQVPNEDTNSEEA